MEAERSDTPQVAPITQSSASSGDVGYGASSAAGEGRSAVHAGGGDDSLQEAEAMMEDAFNSSVASSTRQQYLRNNIRFLCGLKTHKCQFNSPLELYNWNTKNESRHTHAPTHPVVNIQLV